MLWGGLNFAQSAWGGTASDCLLQSGGVLCQLALRWTLMVGGLDLYYIVLIEVLFVENRWGIVGIVVGVIILVVVLVVIFVIGFGGSKSEVLTESEIVRDLNIMQAEVDDFSKSFKVGALSEKRIGDFKENIEKQIGREIVVIFEISTISGGEEKVKRKSDEIESDLKNDKKIVFETGDVVFLEVRLEDEGLMQDGMPSAYTKVAIN